MAATVVPGVVVVAAVLAVSGSNGISKVSRGRHAKVVGRAVSGAWSYINTYTSTAHERRRGELQRDRSPLHGERERITQAFILYTQAFILYTLYFILKVSASGSDALRLVLAQRLLTNLKLQPMVKRPGLPLPTKYKV